MFENVGGKIQGMAKVLCWISIISYIIIGIYLITVVADIYDSSYFVGFGIGILIAGPLTAWAGSLVMYGFGQLVETYCENSSQSSSNSKKDNDDELPEL